MNGFENGHGCMFEYLKYNLTRNIFITVAVFYNFDLFHLSWELSKARLLVRTFEMLDGNPIYTLGFFAWMPWNIAIKYCYKLFSIVWFPKYDRRHCIWMSVCNQIAIQNTQAHIYLHIRQYKSITPNWITAQPQVIGNFCAICLYVYILYSFL